MKRKANKIQGDIFKGFMKLNLAGVEDVQEIIMTTVTEFGKMLRILRIENNIMLKDMAGGIGVSAPYLSAIETGKKPVNARLLNNIIMYLKLDKTQSYQLVAVASTLKNDVIIKPANDDEAELALMFACRLDNQTLDISAIMQLLKGECK